MPEPTPEAWAQIRYDYEHTNRPVDDICLEHGTTANTLRHRARRWGWKMRRLPIPAEGPPAAAVLNPRTQQAHFTSPLRGEVGEQQSCEPGEGDLPFETPESPHPNPLPTGEREQAELGSTISKIDSAGAFVGDEPSPHLVPAAGAPPATDPALIGRRLQSAVAHVLPAIEAALARLGGPLQPRQMEQVARALGSLTRTLRELNGLLVQYGAQEPERDIEEIHASLSRKLEALVAEQEAEDAEREAQEREGHSAQGSGGLE
ncbi:MAG TPA: hypothetical protein VFL51_11225 [Pseudolabrys sp.]|nr:hypothetical protein [Pseudolabrys sp.]